MTCDESLTSLWMNVSWLFFCRTVLIRALNARLKFLPQHLTHIQIRTLNKSKTPKLLFYFCREVEVTVVQWSHCKIHRHLIFRLQTDRPTFFIHQDIPVRSQIPVSSTTARLPGPAATQEHLPITLQPPCLFLSWNVVSFRAEETEPMSSIKFCLWLISAQNIIPQVLEVSKMFFGTSDICICFFSQHWFCVLQLSHGYHCCLVSLLLWHGVHWLQLRSVWSAVL